jgi:hypothetical protein
MARRGRKPNKVTVPPIVEPTSEAEATRTARVIAMFQEVCTRWAEGKSMEQIAGELGVGTGIQLRKVIENNRALRVVLDEFSQFRADSLFEQAVTWGRRAGEVGHVSGDSRALKVAIDTAFKAAAQMAPDRYGDSKKTEIRDAKGKLVATETTVSSAPITPGEAYERMLKGA